MAQIFSRAQNIAPGWYFGAEYARLPSMPYSPPLCQQQVLCGLWGQHFINIFCTIPTNHSAFNCISCSASNQCYDTCITSVEVIHKQGFISTRNANRVADHWLCRDRAAEAYTGVGNGLIGGVYTNGGSTITFRGNHYWYHGGYDADGDFDLKGDTLSFLPSANWQQKMTSEDRNSPLAAHLLGREVGTATVTSDKSTFIMGGFAYHRQ